MKTSKALEDARAALQSGVHPAYVVAALIAEGFEEAKAITIVRWGAMYLQNKLSSIEEPGTSLEKEQP